MSAPLSHRELLDEAQWLLDGRMHECWVPGLLGHTAATISRIAYGEGRRDLGKVFANLAKDYRARKAAA